METKAAVAWEAGKPLSIQTVNLDGPKEGEVLVEVKATGICHTDEFTRSGADPEGLFPAILGHEGAGVVVDTGPGVTSLKKADHVIPLYTPECRQCEYCTSGKTNLCQAIRTTQGQGVMPDGTSRFSIGKDRLFHYMGTSTFANHTVLPEIALARVREDAPFDKICYIGCGVTTGIGAVINTAKVKPGDNVIVFGLGGIGLNVIQGARLVDADMIVGVDINPARKALGEQFGMTHFVNPKEVRISSIRRKSRAIWFHTWSTSPRAAPTTRSSASATSPPCVRRSSAATRAGAKAPSSASPAPARKSRHGRSNLSPAACGAAPRSAAPKAAPTCRKLSTGTWMAESISMTSSRTPCRLTISTMPST